MNAHIRLAFTVIAAFCLSISASLAQDSRQDDIVIDALSEVSSSSYHAASRQPAIAANTKRDEPVTYVDREHAFYRAQVRKCEVHAPYKATAGKDDYYIVVEKSKYALCVYNANDELLVTYPIVLGNNDLGDKMCEGDKETPEGTFHIINKKEHNQWDKYLALDYPNKESYEKFNARKSKGLIPANVSIGGGIGLHGTRPHEDITIDRNENWTYGCVSTKNAYIDELYAYIPVGTRVIIRK